MAFSVVAQRPLRSLKSWRNFWDPEEFRMFGLHLNWLLSFSSLLRFYLFLPKLQRLQECGLLAAGCWELKWSIWFAGACTQPPARSCWAYFILVSVLASVCVCVLSPTPVSSPAFQQACTGGGGGGHQMQRFRWRLEGKLRLEIFLVVSRGLQFSWFI